jgi:N6-L-threonylcarbamoyladenine synthase
MSTAEPLVLGIETSCDETAAAVVTFDGRVRSSVVASQHELHEEYGGVVPEIASRAHVERILPVVREALREAGIGLDRLSGVAVGHRPGLIGSILIGLSAAKALAWSLGVPLIGVDHVHAHLFAGMLREAEGGVQAGADAEPRFPALGLVVSGGHTSMYRIESWDSMSRLGSTIDDALGEAYDKAAVMLGLPHPGGPNLDRLAGEAGADDGAFEFPLSRLSPTSLDFSFSGLKTAVLYAVRGVPGRDGTFPRDLTEIDETTRRNLAASFQRAASAVVILKLERALERLSQEGVRKPWLLTGGGVTANSRLRAELASLAERRGLELRVPPMKYCVDNAAMIAGLGARLLQAGQQSGLDLPAEATTRL